MNNDYAKLEKDVKKTPALIHSIRNYNSKI